MIVETNAIVLQHIKYSETSIIAHLYTEEFGNSSYIMNNVRTNRSKMAMFQPLSVVRITAYRKKNANQIHRISNIQFQLVPTNITNNVFKSTIALFAGEITNQIFRIEEKSTLIFNYLRSFVSILEESETNYANLHILYLLHLTRILGVFPRNNFSNETPLFSQELGEFVSHGESTLSAENSQLFARILQTHEITDSVLLNQQERQTLLSILLNYYDIHVCKTQNIKSLEILRMVFA